MRDVELRGYVHQRSRGVGNNEKAKIEEWLTTRWTVRKLRFPMTTLIAPVTPLSTLSICYRALFAADAMTRATKSALIEAERLLSHVEVFAKLIRAVLTQHNFHSTNRTKDSMT